MTDMRHKNLAFIVAVLLLAWGMRLCWLEEVPPGWRDDELINIHALSGQLLQGEFPLYYLGASGHEPLYHHLHAGVHALLGFNVLSGHILSIMFGTLSVALIYSVVRRLFPNTRAPATIAALTLTTSFWSLMYSRTAIRHISLPPFVLVTVYVLWRRLDAEASSPWRWVPVGLLMAVSLYTYTASRLLPVLVAAFAGYLALFGREQMQGKWQGIALAFVVMLVLVAPLGVAIAQGRSVLAIQGIGADARVTELADPVRALRDGDPGPLLASVVKTLGMFHASGDPEWLYNIPGRPVFNLFGGVLLWIGVAICLCRWREPRCFFLLSWLGLGISPAFISTPPASLGHTIVAQPVAYIFPAVALIEICRLVGWRHRFDLKAAQGLSWPTRAVTAVMLGGFVLTTGVRDIRDYFVVWPERGMVRLLYRADQREAADYLSAHPEITDVAIGSGLMGPWDRLALKVDVDREDVAFRLFNPERSLVWAAGTNPSIVLLPSWPDPARTIEALLGPGSNVFSHLALHTPPTLPDDRSMVAETRFENGLVLAQVRWLGEGPVLGREADLLTVWYVSEPLELSPMPIIAQPPPPETYTGSRLSVSCQLLDADGRPLDDDDGLWVDPLTLRPGDSFVQIHRFAVPYDSASQPHTLALGLYDPKTNERWHTEDLDGGLGADLVTIPIGERS